MDLKILYTDKWNITDLSGNGLTGREGPELKMDDEHHIGIYFDSTSRIKSEFVLVIVLHFSYYVEKILSREVVLYHKVVD